MRLLSFLILLFFFACKNEPQKVPVSQVSDLDFIWKTEAFEDVQILRIKSESYNNLSLKQKLLVYYLTQAGLSGRDIIYDQNHRYNLIIRRTLEKIITDFNGDKTTEDWKNLERYTKLIWFSNGIHHPYSKNKILPRFTRDYFDFLLNETNLVLNPEVKNVIFNPKIDSKIVSFDHSKDLINQSAVNFYDRDLTEPDVDAYYKSLKLVTGDSAISFGLNSKIVLNGDGSVSEKIWKLDGMYDPAIKKIIFWLEKAIEVVENQEQAEALNLLIKYYSNGDLKLWEEFKHVWSKNQIGDIEFINSFIDVSNDPKGMKATFKSIVEIKDFEATKRIKIISENAQWFENNSPIFPKCKKKKVIGTPFKETELIYESAFTTQNNQFSTKHPMLDWFRQKHGLQTAKYGNIEETYNNVTGKLIFQEFASTNEEIERYQKYNHIVNKVFIELQQIIGQSLAQSEVACMVPSDGLNEYNTIMKEAIADLKALYFIVDPKMVELKLLPSSDVGKTAYEIYMLHGLMIQLNRLDPGKNIEEAQMKIRQLIAVYAFEKAQSKNVISKVNRGKKTYYRINDYAHLRHIFGELLIEFQQILSQGDYDAAKNLFEKYCVIADQNILAEVNLRINKLNLPPCNGFIQPEFILVKDDLGKIIDIKIEYPKDYSRQMLNHSKKYSFLPNLN